MEYDVYRNAVIKGFELVLETGGKLLGKSSNSFSLLPLRWTGSTSRMYYAIPPNMACSRPTRSDAVFFYRDNRNLTAHDYGETPAEEALRLKPS